MNVHVQNKHEADADVAVNKTHLYAELRSMRRIMVVTFCCLPLGLAVFILEVRCGHMCDLMKRCRCAMHSVL